MAGCVRKFRVSVRQFCADAEPSFLLLCGKHWNLPVFSTFIKSPHWFWAEPIDGKFLQVLLLRNQSLGTLALSWSRCISYELFFLRTGRINHIYGWQRGRLAVSGFFFSSIVEIPYRSSSLALVRRFYVVALSHTPQSHLKTLHKTPFLLFFECPCFPRSEFVLQWHGKYVGVSGGKRRIPALLPLLSSPWLRLTDSGLSRNGKAVDPERKRNRDWVLRRFSEEPFPEAAHQIFIRTTEGSHLCLQIWGSMRVLELKKRIQVKLGIPATHQILIFSGVCMQDFYSIQYYRVAKDSTITLNLRLRGGSKGSTSKPGGTYRDAAKGKEPIERKEPAAVNITPGSYIVDQMTESPSLSLDIPEVRSIFSDLEKKAVICRFNGFWPKTEALYQWIHSTWTKNCQIHLCSKGFFIVIFLEEEERGKILNEGPWFWGSAGLFIAPWFPEFDANSMVVSRMPVWVRLHNLPLHFWHFKTLATIGNTLGRMLKIDTDRHLKGIFTFARICVEVDLSKGLPESIIMTFNNIQWKQPLDYENTAFRCRGCQQTGHLLKSCPSKSKPQQRKPRGWQNLDEVLKRRTERKKAPSVTEEEQTETEEDDTTIEEVEIEHQKENIAVNKDPQEHKIQTETQQNKAEMESADQSMGANKRQHLTDSSDSDKETGQPIESSQIVIASSAPPLGEWRKVEKKKGRKS